MTNLGYLLPRLVRHFMPEWLTRFLLLRSVIISPGLETVDPAAAVSRYARVLAARNDSLKGKRILVFGYGGRFDVGLGLIEAGAAHVALCDRYARPDARHNRKLLSTHGSHFYMEEGQPLPKPGRMELIEGDVRRIQSPSNQLRYDLVISNSVYEHLDDADGVTRALAKWSTPEGVQVHFVDLRDHFFEYPFEMLRYSERVWRRWLNPTSHHNRLRIWEYRRIFESNFHGVDIEVLGRDETAFERVEPYIRPEFKCGRIEEDAVTLIQVIAQGSRL
jgi:hypothetical protein